MRDLRYAIRVLTARPAFSLVAIVTLALGLAAGGIAIGVAGALVTSRALGALLFGVSATDPLTFVVAAVGLALAGVARGLPTGAAGEPHRSGRVAAVTTKNTKRSKHTKKAS